MVDCGTLTVEEPQADISITDCSLSPGSGSTVEPSDTLQATVSLNNFGDASGTVTVTFTANGQQFGSQTVTVAGNGTDDATAQFTPTSLGVSGSVTVDVQLSGGAAASVTGRRMARTDGGCSTCGM